MCFSGRVFGLRWVHAAPQHEWKYRFANQECKTLLLHCNNLVRVI
jgi:hypothetical protein